MVRSADYVNEHTSNLRHADSAQQTAEQPQALADLDDLSRHLDPDPTENVARDTHESDDSAPLDRTLPPTPTLAENGGDLPAVLGTNLIVSVELSAGDVVANRYVIVSRLPNSGMGQIFKALDRHRQAVGGASPYVALKFSAEAFGRGGDKLAAARNEFRRLSQLHHQNIVQVFDIDVHNDVPFIVMEWLDGKSLLRELDEQSSKRMALKRAREIIQSIASGLSYAHENNVVHGDIKPSNVFISARGGIKLLDFGAASADNATEQSWATRAYASVNVLSGSAAAKADDVYSLGVTAYLLLSGKRPFGNKDAVEASCENLEAEPLPNDASEVWPAIRSALSFDESLRQPDATQFLASYLTENQEQKNPAPPVRSKYLDYAAAAALILLMGTMWWLRLDHVASSEIRADLRQADRALQLGMLVEPDTESALHFFRQALAKSPENAQALDGIDEIASQLLVRAGEALDDDDLNEASRNLLTAGKVAPSHPAIPHVEKLVGRYSTDLIVRAELIANSDPVEAETLLQSAEQLNGGETIRIAELRARMAEAQIDRDMDHLIAGIDERILAERLAVPPRDSAIDLLRQARELRPNDHRIPLAANRIVSALLFQALFAISNDKLDKAAAHIDAAKSLNIRHLATARAEYELAKARNRATKLKYTAELASSETFDPN